MAGAVSCGLAMGEISCPVVWTPAPVRNSGNMNVAVKSRYRYRARISTSRRPVLVDFPGNSSASHEQKGSRSSMRSKTFPPGALMIVERTQSQRNESTENEKNDGKEICCLTIVGR